MTKKPLQAQVVHFLPQIWKQSFLQGVLVPFSQKWYLETTNCVLEMLIATPSLSLSADTDRRYLSQDALQRCQIDDYRAFTSSVLHLDPSSPMA